MYSYMTYMSYVLYPPLYIAGPIMTFNDFLWQVCPCTPLKGGLMLIIVAAPSPDFNHWAHRDALFRAVPRLPPHDGVDTPFHVCCRYQGYQGMDGQYPCSNKHDWLLESHNCLAQST